jgi:two-component system, sensor histidine kinase and response regulator
MPLHRSSPARATLPAAAERSLQERLAGLQGFDCQRALANVVDQWPMLERVLRMFIAMYGQGVPTLQGPPTPENVRQWRSDGHALRGVCATIGATDLGATLLAFEAALAQSGDAALPLARQVNAGLIDFAARLQQCMGPAES